MSDHERVLSLIDLAERHGHHADARRIGRAQRKRINRRFRRLMDSDRPALAIHLVDYHWDFLHDPRWL